MLQAFAARGSSINVNNGLQIRQNPIPASPPNDGTAPLLWPAAKLPWELAAAMLSLRSLAAACHVMARGILGLFGPHGARCNGCACFHLSRCALAARSIALP